MPADTANLFRAHLAVPAAALLAVLLVATLAATAIAGSAIALEVGLLLALPTAFALACCAAYSATNDPFAYLSTSPGIGQAVAAAPLGVAMFAVGVPLLAARATWLEGHSPLPGLLFLEVLLIVVAPIAANFLGVRMAKRSGVHA